MPLVAETGTGRDPAANSYATRVFAAAYHDTGLTGEDWALVDGPEQDRALVAATRLLDTLVDWHGTPVYPGQPLGWPRRWVTGIDRRPFPMASVPIAVRHATAALALKLAKDYAAALEAEASGTAATGATSSTEQQVEEITLGPIGVKLTAASAEAIQAQAEVAAKAARPIPLEVTALLRHWGDYTGGGSGMVRVVRG